MIASKRTNQGGSILTFIIVAVVLTFGVIGTAYFVKQRGEQVRKDQAIARVDKLAKAADTTKQQPTAASSSRQSSGQTTATSTASTPTPAAAKPAPTASSPSPQVQAKPTPLPTTGPESGVVDLIAIGMLVATVTAYLSSRRVLSRSL